MTDAPAGAPVGTPLDGRAMERLYALIESKRDGDPTLSHTAKLFQRGTEKIAQKVGEEAVEAVIDAVTGKRDGLILESADLLYHLLVLWVACGVKPAEVWEALKAREGRSGLTEKTERP
jgi:phosphoribosyl-ATP pyrophosphohydrolase